MKVRYRYKAWSGKDVCKYIPVYQVTCDGFPLCIKMIRMYIDLAIYLQSAIYNVLLVDTPADGT